MLVLLILSFLVITCAEVPVLVAAGQWRELRAFGVLLALGFALSLAVTLRWPVPHPNYLLRLIFEPVADWLGIK
ncbi:MAG TPA: hypothetical protein VK191_10540 [Symbiobacteriaceae bacterium]|nr:hypothetical protein [Symbiobacteriaceae bacterium]